MVRRFVVADTASDLWTVHGYTDDEGNEEREEVEMFDGMYFAARPHALDRAEVIVLKVGGESGHPVGVGSRAHDTRKIFDLAEGLSAGECAMFNRESMVKIASDGTVKVGSLGGTMQALATKADIDATNAVLASHTHLQAGSCVGAGTPTATGLPTAPTAAGTQKLEAE